MHISIVLKKLIWLTIVGPSGISSEIFESLAKNNNCQPLITPFCTQLGYNQTIMPNLLGHSNQEEASLEFANYSALVKICGPDILLFLCSVYVPVCTNVDKVLPPCRSLCLTAKESCESTLNQFTIPWPPALNCDNYPDNPSLCVKNDSSISSDSTTLRKYENRNRMRVGQTYSDKHRDIGFVCPIQFQVRNNEYSLKVGHKVEPNCGAPCEQMFFSEPRRQFARVWIGTWAILCALSCLFTVCTFLIDTQRFRYPERPIIFLSLCYLMVAVAYVIGFIAGDKIACSKAQLNSAPLPYSVSTIVQGTKYEMCTIIFMVLYFFTMASSIWWVVLTLTWLLAAGLKWGHEAIEANSQYFHLAAWAIPAIKTITVLAMGKVDGDILSGVCYVGLWKADAMQMFVLIPLLVYLGCGLVFLASGFISLFRIRTVMKHDGTKTDKLEKLMIRIGVFSMLYTMPAIVVIGCLSYELYYFDQWMLTWNNDMCLKSIYSVPCPPKKLLEHSRPIFEIFMVKYLMYMIVGITSSVWIWSGKTVHSWRVFFNRLRGRHAEAHV